MGGEDDGNWLATHGEMGGNPLVKQALGGSGSAIPCIAKRWSVTSQREGVFAAASFVMKQLNYMEMG